MEPIVLVHGGADEVLDEHVPRKVGKVKKAALIGYEVLKSGGSSLDAVEAAIRYMEDDEDFNAGYGSSLNWDGEVEMDASIMVGSDLSTGAVTVVKDIAHPISLARLVMEKTPHVRLAGTGANRFAKEQGVPALAPGSLVCRTVRQALDQLKENKGSGYHNSGQVDTVGAVAMDANGHLAAGTSTGGTNGKMVGRCSDSSSVGSGTYADDSRGAISATGHGESIIKICLAHEIIKGIELKKTAQQSTEDALNKLTTKLKNTAGAITISKDGQTGIYFTSSRMPWAYIKGNEIHYGIEHNENHTEQL